MPRWFGMTDTSLHRLLASVSGSLNERAELLLEELNLKEPSAANRMEWSGSKKPQTPQKEEDQKGTDEPWRLPGQSSQQAAKEPPPKPDYGNPERKT
jgi:hypothetical protein